VRRWYAAMPVLGVALLIGSGVVDSAASEYRATGSVVILRYDPTPVPPTDDPQDTGAADDGSDGEATAERNPYADFNGSVNITASVLANLGGSVAVRSDIVDGGGTSDYSVDKDEDAPILHIEATASRPARAIESVNLIVAALEKELASRQEQLGVPVEDQMVVDVLVLPDSASELNTARNRALTAVIAITLAGVVASTVIAESVAVGRARHRRSASFGSPDGTPMDGLARPFDLESLADSNDWPSTPSRRQ
jgi:hypothetical protein